VVVKRVPAFVAGALFGVGLMLSGMTSPHKVAAFLDVGGGWDPSLAFVMVGAIGVFALVYRLVARRGRTVAGGPLHLPTTRYVDGQLVTGAAVFGVGWGLAGYCPGPALVTAASGALPGVIFVVAMIAGMAIAGRRAG
jgi:uncharacterized membrane protein YedE/YeeE